MLKGFGYAFASWPRNKIVDPLLQILRRGVEPNQLAFSASLGITLGLFPICGVTVFLCGIAIAVLGSLCHAPTVMLANFIATPIELSWKTSAIIYRCLSIGMVVNLLYVYFSIFILIEHYLYIMVRFSHLAVVSFMMIPFLRFGEFITGGAHFPLTSDALKKVLSGRASKDVLQSIVHALLGWVVAAPFILGGLYLLCLPCFKMLVGKLSPPRNLNSISSPRKPTPNSPPSEVRLKVRDV